MTPQTHNSGPLRIGDTFVDRYQILGVIGRGGFGCVYRARSQFMGREVAIKVMDRNNKLTDELRARGQREAVILGQLEHPNIVRVYEAEVSQSGHLYIVMELLEGMCLAERLHKQGPFTVREGLVLLEQLCSALQSAHKIKAVHRDLKPGNIFLCKDGTARILDFGIAKIAGNAGWQTAPNMVVGTSLYISPEQIRGQPASHLSDIYSIGLVAFQMFQGTHPLILQEPAADLRDPHMVWHLQIKTRAPLLDAVIPGFPPHVARLVHTALAKDPGQRFQSAAEMAEKTRIALLRLDADEGRARSSEFIPARPEPSQDARAQVGHEATEKQDNQSKQTAPSPATEQHDRKRTKKLFADELPLELGTGVAPVRLATLERQPAPERQPTFERQPSSKSPPPPTETIPPGVAARRSSTPSTRPDLPSARERSQRESHPPEPTPLEQTTGVAQNVSRTLKIPVISNFVRNAPPGFIPTMAIILGLFIGAALMVRFSRQAASLESTPSNEITIEPIANPASAASNAVPPAADSAQAEGPAAEKPAEPAPLSKEAPEPEENPAAQKKAEPPAALPAPAPKVQPTTTVKAPAPAPKAATKPSTKKTSPTKDPMPSSGLDSPPMPDSGLWLD